MAAKYNKKNKSPLKQTAHQQALANNPYYSYLQLGGWDEAQQEIDRRSAERRKAEQDALQNELSNIQLAEMKVKQQQGLIVPADTGYNNVDIAIQNASRQLVDQAGSLTAQLKNGEIDTDQYANKLAIIRSQVPAVNTFKEVLTGNLQNYQQAVADNQISHAMTAEARDFYGSIMNDSGQLQLGATEDGNIALLGLTNGGEEVNIPVGGVNQMYRPILKQPAPQELLRDPMKTLQKEQEFWGPEGVDFAKAQLDNVLNSGGEDALKSLAADHYGYDVDRLEEEYMAPPPEGSEANSLLEHNIENAWVSQAQGMFINDQQDANQRVQSEIQRQRAIAQQQQGAGRPSAALIDQQNAYNLNQENTNKVDTALNIALQSATKRSDGTIGPITDASAFQNLVGVGGIQGIEIKHGGLGFGDPRTIEVMMKGAKEPIPIPIENAAAGFKQLLGVQQNLVNPGLQANDPLGINN